MLILKENFLILSPLNLCPMLLFSFPTKHLRYFYFLTCLSPLKSLPGGHIPPLVLTLFSLRPPASFILPNSHSTKGSLKLSLSSMIRQSFGLLPYKSVTCQFLLCGTILNNGVIKVIASDPLLPSFCYSVLQVL